jgi:hypothetical protein
MHERIESFLKDVSRYQGKHSKAVQDGVRHLLTEYEKQFRETETDPPRGVPAAQQFRKLCRERIIEEIQQRTAISSISHFQTVLSVIDAVASE